MKVFVYRNRSDDLRTRSELVFCEPCGGWYGVPHDMSHCQQQMPETKPRQCACRFCRETSGLPVEGSFGFWSSAQRWQP